MRYLGKAEIEAAFKAQELFDSKSWVLSPLAFQLSPRQTQDLEAIGQACIEFYRAQDRLYYASKKDRSLLRNQDYKAPWVASYLDRGKPSFLLDYSDSLATKLPLVIRPDLLWTEEGWILTELDAVPGGVGLTAFLYALYGYTEQAEHFLESLWGGLTKLKRSEQEMKQELKQALTAIVVSEESKTYRPEWEWIALQWQKKGRKIACLSPEELCFETDGVYTPSKAKIDLVYRFFELFDWPQVQAFKALLEAESKAQIAITSPIKPHQEEKLSLALFHHPLLEDYWKEQLTVASYQLLKRIIPPSWIVDFSPLPPGAYWEGPSLGGKPLRNYMDLQLASQKERKWILKISGFDETAWGSRGLTLGNDVNQKAWEAALLKAKHQAKERCYILQDYKKPLVLEHPVYTKNGLIEPMQGRLRLCPYYLSSNQGQYLGALATLCPKDKKIIHGMQDAALLPAISAC